MWHGNWAPSALFNLDAGQEDEEILAMQNDLHLKPRSFKKVGDPWATPDAEGTQPITLCCKTRSPSSNSGVLGWWRETAVEVSTEHVKTHGIVIILCLVYNYSPNRTFRVWFQLLPNFNHAFADIMSSASNYCTVIKLLRILLLTLLLD